MDGLTVADELVYDALPDDIRKICDKKIDAAREDDDSDLIGEAHSAGVAEGKRLGEEQRRSLQDQADKLATDVNNARYNAQLVEQENAKLRAELANARAALDLARKAKTA